ncbi:hypothetical protein [Nocardiopsis ansamitocini]|uniref:Subtilisin inhibitor domain-containing protein n=1 Tax=Nocardiopsis ansamitocini TaxID=1670832 RepID=A0A9W6UIJ9_9ACTN|nr:hypothetical protein [Nocardiopsis ansamitocini]GLU47777.1 hypothetical protein Nans01_21280 [Nocardiopsis ansamitocini]
MSKLNPRRGFLGTIGTVVLGSLCLGGAVAYTAVVGTSLVGLPETMPEAQELHTISGLTDLPPAPVAFLSVEVVDGEDSYERTLSCFGDPLSDPASCGELAQAAEQEDPAGPFEEVSSGSICTDVVYGAEHATITGTWEGVEIATEVTREGSCHEARWQRLTALTDRPE